MPLYWRGIHYLGGGNVFVQRQENAPKASDMYWISYTGHNYAKWADKDFSIALGILRDTPPQAGETIRIMCNGLERWCAFSETSAALMMRMRTVNAAVL
ncbi:MAG: hypothetical protein GY832_40865 [Chloroflexi bacterium]|nr:hypothetical protein [Chloroflexota bacterium]